VLLPVSDAVEQVPDHLVLARRGVEASNQELASARNISFCGLQTPRCFDALGCQLQMPVALQGASGQPNRIVEVSCGQRIRHGRAPLINAGVAVNAGGEISQPGITVRRGDALAEDQQQQRSEQG
jgi:hypothetical protein